MWPLLRYIPSLICCEFYHTGTWVLSDAVYTPIRMIRPCLSFIMLMSCITCIDLCMLNHHCDLGMNYIWSWYMITFMHCWIWFANILLRIFASIFIKECNFLFSWCLYLVLISGWWWLHINRMLLGVFSLLQFFGRVWEGSVKVFMFGRPVKPFGLGFLFAVCF